MLITAVVWILLLLLLMVVVVLSRWKMLLRGQRLVVVLGGLQYWSMRGRPRHCATRPVVA